MDILSDYFWPVQNIHYRKIKENAAFEIGHVTTQK